ncbi:MAG: glycosyltransferase [Pedosphaera sp.]|nr:glycosyltransferase [Pedosphaera sp.]
MREGFLRRTLVVIPAWNEIECVASTVREWLDIGVGRVRVVDNGSTDGTEATARAAGAEVLMEPIRGYGAAAWRGLQDWPAGFDWVLFSSADGSDMLTIAELAAWQAAVDAGGDLILGNRLNSAELRKRLKWVQRFGNSLSCAVIAAGWGRSFQDMAALRLVRHGALGRMQLQDRGFGWNVEMQVRALELEMQVIEIPVVFRLRRAGESKISGSWAGSWRAGKGILRMLWLLWQLRTTGRSAPSAPKPVAFVRHDN